MSASLVRKSLALIDDDSDYSYDASETSNKYTVVEAKKHIKSRSEIIKKNKEKVKLLKEACKLKIDPKIKDQLIKRAVKRRPVHEPAPERRKDEKTAFTEEDFKKFAEEYEENVI